MPSYEYRCPKCNKKFTLILSIGEHDVGKVKCPKCGGKKLQQLITAFQVKTSRKSKLGQKANFRKDFRENKANLVFQNR
jgi:putative FmdB family regulatory protein